MYLADKYLDFYVQSVLAFKREDKQKYQDQIDFLKTTLTNAINRGSALRVTKINQAGSWRKGTALKPRDGFAVDIDLVVYLDISEADRSDIAKLHQLLVDLLSAAHPTKSREDFKKSKKTVGIEFRTSGLMVDLVPVIPVESLPEYVWQPEIFGTGSFITSPSKQLEFIDVIKNDESRFASIVRILKQWRNHTELLAFSSFTIELLVAHVVAGLGPASTIEDGVIRALLEIAQSKLKTPISFPGAIRSCPPTSSPVRIYDPTNNENNVTSRTTDAERADIVKNATEALEILNYAQGVSRKGDTVDLWKRVVGPSFKIEEA